MRRSFEAEFTDVRLDTERGVFDARVERMTNRGTGPNLVVGDLEAKLADCIRHGQSDLDPSTVWSRLRSSDDVTAWTYGG